MKDWFYPQMIQAIKEKVVANSIILVFSPTKLSELVSMDNDMKRQIAKLMSNIVNSRKLRGRLEE